MKPLRLFWALNLSLDVKEKLSQTQKQLKQTGANVKWVEEENFHLTIKFLGDVHSGNVSAVTEKVRAEVSGIGNINLIIEGLGVFPRRGLPRVIWAGVKDDKGKLLDLQQRVERGLTPLGFMPEAKGYSPHLTLGRNRSPQGIENLLKKIAELNSRNTGLGNVDIRTVDLMQSELTRQGPKYSILEAIRL